MIKMPCLLLALLILGFQASAAERTVQQMTCELKNFFGLKVGTVHKTPRDFLRLKYGFLANQLKVDQVSDLEIVAIDRDVNYSYTFTSGEPMSQQRGTYNGILYQQYIKGLEGPNLPVAQFKCAVVFK